MPRTKKIKDVPEVIPHIAPDPVLEKEPELLVINTIIMKTVPAGPIEGEKRQFSLAKHGKDFKKIAEEYCKKFNGKFI